MPRAWVDGCPWAWVETANELVWEDGVCCVPWQRGSEGGCKVMNLE